MEVTVSAQVKIYLYTNGSTLREIGFNERIEDAEVYASKEAALGIIRANEEKGVKDGEEFEYDNTLGKMAQYHDEYQNGKGQQVWELRTEWKTKDGARQYSFHRVREITL